MNARNIVPLLIVVVASAGALLSTADHHEAAQLPDHHHNAILEGHNDHHDAFDHHDDVAVADMLHHAATHLDTAGAIPDSYVALPSWKPSWELRWMDFHHGDHAVRLYHATDHHHPETRFVIAVDDTEHDVVQHWMSVQ